MSFEIVIDIISAWVCVIDKPPVKFRSASIQCFTALWRSNFEGNVYGK